MAAALQRHTVADATRGLAAGECSSVDLVASCRATIEERDPTVRAYLEVFDDADEAARASDKRRAEGKDTGVLDGIPVAIKDNILIQGKCASAASKMLESYTAAYDAHVTKRLREGGAVFLGRTNMDEFAMGGSTEQSAYQLTRNPLDEERVPGGSSGGSAAAVAYGGALAALGTDTGGSIRQPASFCGLVGLKPTYGAVSRRGLVAMGSSLDQAGPITKTVEDARIVFEAIAGHDPKDSTSLPESSEATSNTSEVRRIGVPRAFLGPGVASDVKASFERMLEQLASAGYEVVDIELPTVDKALATYYIIMPAEVSSNLARFDGVRYGLHVESDSVAGVYKETRGAGFGAEVKRRIMLGTYVLSAGYYDAYYGAATAARARILDEFTAAFASVDVIATPTTPTTAFNIGEKQDPVSMYAADLFTTPANLTGLPALSVPSAPSENDGMPVGFQITAPSQQEGRLFSLGADVERLNGAQ